GAVLIYIPADDFTMGDADQQDNPLRTIFLEGYWIYRVPVTVAQYLRFCQETERAVPMMPPWGWKDHHPIVNIRWHDASAYCDWAGMALPTEAQWEKAARGTDGRKYPWGNDWEVGPNRCARARVSTSPVGSYLKGASPYGVLDMAGNVWEW